MSERPLTLDFETTAQQSIAFGGRLKLCVFRQAVNKELEILRVEFSGMDGELREVAPKIHLYVFIMGPFKAKKDI